MYAPAQVFRNDQWHHVALSYDGAKVRLYADGRFLIGREMNGSLHIQWWEIFEILGAAATYPFGLGNLGASPVGLFGPFMISNKARYTSETTYLPPTEQFVPDANSMVTCNWAESYRGFSQFVLDRAGAGFLAWMPMVGAPTVSGSYQIMPNVTGCCLEAGFPQEGVDGIHSVGTYYAAYRDIAATVTGDALRLTGIFTIVDNVKGVGITGGLISGGAASKVSNYDGTGKWLGVYAATATLRTCFCTRAPSRPATSTAP